MQIKKQTKIWKTKTGEKIRICDMTDKHLLNCVNFLDAIYETFLNYEDEGLVFSIKEKLPDIYFNLKDEAERRGLCE